MKHRINIRGVMVPNDYKWYYDFFGEDCTCPKDVQQVMDAFADGDEIEVYINSPGGVIDVGSEIYTLLKERKDNVRIYITGEACSAASVAAMAAYCEMSPTALMMVHCVSTYAVGNHRSLEHTAEVLRTADRALCSAYVDKSGMTEEEALEMMEHTTWLTAEQALKRGLIDAVMFRDEETAPLVAGPLFSLPTKEQMEKADRAMKEGAGESTLIRMARAKLDFLRLRD
ncbi:MAG: Clp protease ClpP [Lachnospiraceae bacterium]|nr:Clp protease ClpP [Lachnospiraceae bacterium]